MSGLLELIYNRCFHPSFTISLIQRGKKTTSTMCCHEAMVQEGRTQMQTSQKTQKVYFQRQKGQNIGRG